MHTAAVKKNITVKANKTAIPAGRIKLIIFLMDFKDKVCNSKEISFIARLHIELF